MAHKLDMFKQVLPNLDRHNLDFFSTLDEDQQKGFFGVVAMRWMSCAKGEFADWYLAATNQRANPRFFEMYRHPELQWKLLASNGHGAQVRHEWVPNQAKSASSAALNAFISRYWPQANTMEIETILRQFSRESFSEFVDGTGVDKEEAKRVKDSFKARGV
jgi:hypothetical protein